MLVAAAALLSTPAFGAPAPDRPPAGVNPQPDPVGQPAAREPARQPVVTRSSPGTSSGVATATRTVVVQPAVPTPAAERPAQPRPRARQSKPAPRKTTPARAEPQRPFLETAWTRALDSPQTLAASLPDTAESDAAALRASLALLALVVASGALLVTAHAWMEE